MDKQPLVILTASPITACSRMFTISTASSATRPSANAAQPKIIILHASRRSPQLICTVRFLYILSFYNNTVAAVFVVLLTVLPRFVRCFYTMLTSNSVSISCCMQLTDVYEVSDGNKDGH